MTINIYFNFTPIGGNVWSISTGHQHAGTQAQVNNCRIERMYYFMIFLDRIRLLCYLVF